MSRSFLLVLVLAVLQGASCASEPETGGWITLEMPLTGGNWFQLRICESLVTVDDEGVRTCETIFNSGCSELLEPALSLTGLPSGKDRIVLYESYSVASCDPGSEVALGYRGGVEIPATDEVPYYFIPIYEANSVTALPEDLSVSAGVSVEVPLCTEDAECEEELGAPGGCFKQLAADGSQYNHYCLPTCTDDAACQGFHPGSVCDETTSLCVLRHPYPLNMSSGRVYGSTVVTGDGSVLLVGGFDHMQSGRLMAAGYFMERFSSTTGVFDNSGLQWAGGVGASARGFTGATSLTPDLHAIVGGLRSVALGIEGEISLQTLAGKICQAGEETENCNTNNISDEVNILDTSAGEGRTGSLPLATAAPAVVGLDASTFLVLGGWVNEEANIEKSAVRSDQIVHCTVTDESVNCVGLETVLGSPRAGHDARCWSRVDGTNECKEVLVVGGNDGVLSADLLSVAGAAVVVQPMTMAGLPAGLSWPSFCGELLISGTHPATLAVDVASNTVTATPVANDFNAAANVYLAASAEGGDDGCWLIGGAGRETTEASDNIYKVTSDGISAQSHTLHQARIGASAGTISQGPLKGSVIIGGGLTVDGTSGEVTMVRGAEVLRP